MNKTGGDADSNAKRWLMHIGVAAGYALAYVVIRPFSVALWPFAAGLRVACLMLVPRRYWAALVVGEAIPLTYFNVQCLDDFGLAWVVINSIPFIALGMPVMSWFRNRAGLFPTPAMVNLTRLLVCMLALSAFWTLLSYVVLSTIRLPTGPYEIPSGLMMMSLVGNYMVLLLTVPWIIMIRIRGRKKNLRHFLPISTRITHPLMRDVGMAVLILAALVWWYHVADANIQSTPLMAMFLPAMWLTLKHGWRVSVLSGTLSLACICLLLPWSTDTFNQQAQTLMAMAITGLYFAGARISEMGRDYGRIQREARDSKDVARAIVTHTETRLERTASAIDAIAAIHRSDYEPVLARIESPEEREDFLEQRSRVQRYMRNAADALYPSAWRTHGLGGALYESIGNALRPTGVIYDCDGWVRELRFLSPALQSAIYRVSCDAVAALVVSPACVGIRLAIRTGRRKVGGGWVGVRIHSLEDEANVAQGLMRQDKREGVASALGANLRTVEEARKLVRAFDGQLELRTLLEGRRVSMLLCDQTPDGPVHQAPMRLWVE
jgi:hypothetical protein